jgi:hypothetical protein
MLDNEFVEAKWLVEVVEVVEVEEGGGGCLARPGSTEGRTLGTEEEESERDTPDRRHTTAPPVGGVGGRGGSKSRGFGAKKKEPK